MLWNRKNEEQEGQNFTVLSNRKSNVVKKATIMVLLMSSLTFNMAFASEENNKALKEIHHIYAEGQYIGAISDRKEMEKLFDKKVQESSSQYNDLQLKAGNNLKVVTEQVYTPSTNDESTLQKLDEFIEVEATAFALSVNDEMAVYVKDIETYHEAIKKLKLQFISEEELAILEARKSVTDSLPELQTGETRIVDLILKQEVSGVTVDVAPEKIVSADEAVKLLLEGTLEKETYKVSAGDVLGNIASKFNLTSEELLKINPGLTDTSVLQIDQELNVTVLKPLINMEVVYEKKVEEIIPHTKQVIETEEMYKGDTKVKQEGQDGKRVATYLVRQENGVQVGQSLSKETILEQPKEHVVLKGTKVIPSRGSGVFAWPAEGGYISSKMGYRWGRKHEGIDIARPSGFNIKAADNGVVEAAGWDGTYGNRVIVNHKNGYKTTYAHLSSVSVSVGDVVPQGSKLGVMGSTGRSTGTHLHFEVKKDGVTIDPLSVLK